MKRSQVYLLIVVIAVSSYAYFVEYKGTEKKQVLEEIESQLIDFSKDQINRIEIQTATKEKPVILEKLSSGWILKSPIDELADNQRVDEFLTPLVAEKRIAIAQSGNEIKWNNFGLEVPAGTIQLKNQLGDSVQFSVSNLKNFQGDSFIRKNQENTVYTSSAAWTERVYKNESFFRDRSIMRFPIAGVREVKIHENQKIHLKFDSGEWTITPTPEGRLNQNKLREIVNAFADAKAETFDSKKPVSQKIMSAELIFADQKKWKADFFESKDKEIYVKVDSMPNYMKIGSVFWSKVYNIQLSELVQKKEEMNSEVQKAINESEKK